VLSSVRNDDRECILTGVFVELDEELGEEAGRAHDHERRTGGVVPEEGRKSLEERIVEVVCDDDGKGDEPGGVGVEHGVEGSGVGEPLDAVIELQEEADGLGSSVLVDAFERVQEEVVPGICTGDGLVVEDGEVASAGEDEVLEDGRGRGTARYDQHAGGFEGGLTARCPEAGGDGEGLS